MDKRQLGTVNYWNFSRGYGFIVLDTGEDVFCHASAILGNDTNKQLFKNQEVELSIVESDRGLQAREVLPLTEEFLKD